MKLTQKKSSAILVRVTPDMRQKIDDYADDENCTITELIRSMIDHCIKELDAKKAK